MIEMTEKLQEILQELKTSHAETYYHSLRVKTLVAKMLKQMNRDNAAAYTPQEIAYICKGALLHDVGKLHVKNVILTKDASLTPEEKTSMSRHTEAGFFMIQGELCGGEFEMVKNICLYHHERIDGNGYMGRKDLPVYVQAVAVCDVFDALYTDRIYRKGLSYQDAMQVIKNGGCGLFDQCIIAYLEKAAGYFAK